MSQLRIDTSAMRAANNDASYRTALRACADGFTSLSNSLSSIRNPRGDLRGDKNTVMVRVEMGMQAQHMPLGTVAVSGGSGTPTASNIHVDGAVLDDGSSEGVAGSFPVPPEWKGKRITCYFQWAHSEAATTGNVRLRVQFLPIAHGDDDTGGQQTLNQTVVAAGTNGDNEDQFQHTRMGTFAVGTSTIMVIYFGARIGGDGADTFGAGIWGYNLMFVNE